RFVAGARLGSKANFDIRTRQRFAIARRHRKGERISMSLPASGGEPKLRSGRFDIGFARLTGACARVAFVGLLLVSPAAKAASARPVAAEKGMVVTAQHLASQVGVDILKRGGRAIDAAAAVGYALAVVYPSG